MFRSYQEDGRGKSLITWTKADETWTKLATRFVNDDGDVGGVGENIPPAITASIRNCDIALQHARNRGVQGIRIKFRHARQQRAM
jgi:hypothetical protein